MQKADQPAPTTADSPWLQEYLASAGALDECRIFTERGNPDWQNLFASLQSLSADDLVRRQREIRRELSANGVSFNVHGDPNGLNRPWQLDPIPMLMDGREWEQLTAGLTQRAELLNLILQDVYGKRNLIRGGLLPPEVVYAHQGFLHACDGVHIPGSQQLLLYGADLARGPDRQWWVISDRTQAPSGTGYALENRQCLARVMPQLFRECQVRRLGDFFQQLRDLLQHLAPSDSPRIGLLTAGPLNETYFEHAYLAAHLGFPLLQGDDLTTRDGQVRLKTLEGLLAIDVILRRLDDVWCDPLELRADSRLGVAGLVEATRRGNVVVANPLGSGILENPGMFPFLPNIARRFLGEELLLQNAATWWCGQPKECQHVLENLEKMVIKPIYNQAQTIFGFRLTKAEKQHWRARIRRYPHHYVGQEHIGFSTTPTLVEGHIIPRPAVLRSLLVARNAGYQVMPGGLAHVSVETEAFSINTRSGGISKDVWVTTDAPDRFNPAWRSGPSSLTDLSESENLPSRAAENLYWVGRYAERAEATARLLRIILRKLHEYEITTEAESLQDLALLFVSLHQQVDIPLPDSESPEPSRAWYRERLAQWLHEQGLDSVLNYFMSSAFNVRDLWSSDTWRVVGEIQDHARRLKRINATQLARLMSALDQLLTSLVAFTGLTEESMIHQHGWRLLELGRRVERGLTLARHLADQLEVVHEPAVEHAVLENVLSAHESLITHRRRNRSEITPLTVMRLLLLDPSNPRSLIYQVERIRETLQELPMDRSKNALLREQKMVLEISTALQLCEAGELLQLADGAETRSDLLEFLNHLQNQLANISQAVSERMFAHTAGIHQLSTPGVVEEL